MNITEARAAVKLMEHNLDPSIPMDPSAQYDFVVRAGRLQIKKTSRFEKGSYKINMNARGNRRPKYTRDAFDFLIGYVEPLDVWYVIPMTAILDSELRHSVRLGKRNAIYIEAWHLLKGESDEPKLPL